MLQPRVSGHFGGAIAVSILFIFLAGDVVLGLRDKWHTDPGDGGHPEIDKLDVERIKRDSSGVTTLLLVNNDEARHIKGSRPEGLLTSTARTFVHDGTTTEYGTQIIGTSLDHGRFYAQLLQTNSRVYFGDQERVPVPRQKPDERVSHKHRYLSVNLENYINPTVFYDIKPAETILVYPTRADDSLNLVKPETVSEESFPNPPHKGEVEILVKESSGGGLQSERSKENDRPMEAVRLKQADGGPNINQTRTFPNDLPTYTVRHDFAPSGFSWNIPESEKEEITVKVEKSKFRSGKGLHGKAAERKLDTVTYLGFAEFTTTVGDTVIVFMPNTRNAGIEISSASASETESAKSNEQKVMTAIKTFMSHSPGMVTRTIPGHNLSMQTSIPTQVAERQSKGFGDNLEVKSSFLSKEQTNFENPTSNVHLSSSSAVVEPSETQSALPVLSSSNAATDPLGTFATTVTKTFGTGGSEKPLGLLKSVGGTKVYNGTTTHFTSLLYGTFVGDSYTQVLKTTSSVFYKPSDSKNIAATKVVKQPEITSRAATAITTEEPSDEESSTSAEEDKTTRKTGDATSEPATSDDVDETTTEEMEEEKIVPSEEYITRIVPSKVYKTFTYLTTFFIPAEDGTTTSIRSREVVSSELSYVTKVVETDLKQTAIDYNANDVKGTEDNLIENDIDPEFLPPATRILAPEELITTTEEPEMEEENEVTTEVVEDTIQDEHNAEEEEEEEDSSEAPTKDPSTAPVPASTEALNPEEEEKEEEEEEQEQEQEETPGSNLEPELRKETTTAASAEDDEEEIEVIFKTIYTTYTYLTTFFQESTTSVSSREVVVTNVITSTLENGQATAATKDATTDVVPTTSSTGIQTTATVATPTTDEAPEESDVSNIEPSTTFTETDQSTSETPKLEINGVKTFYTTFTYFTTLFDKGDVSVRSRTEVVTNVISPTVSVLPASILQNEELLKSKFEMLLREQQSLRTSQAAPSSFASDEDGSTSSADAAPTSNRGISSTANPSSAFKGKYGTLVRKSKISPSVPSSVFSSANELDNSGGRFRQKGDKSDRTVVRKIIRTKSRLIPKSTTVDDNLGITTIRLDPTGTEDDDRIILQTMITDVTKTTSRGNRQVKRIAPPEPEERPILILEDQISSESNTDEIEPSPTLLLQTSYTTFTYFTTVYKGTTSDVISRLETVTNVVTETLKPDVLITPALSPEDATLPITYFTTFTYWTTLYRDGNTVITSREETVSNIVTPTIDATLTELLEEPKIEATPAFEAAETTADVPPVQTVFVPAYVPAAVPEEFTEKEDSNTPSPITNKPIEEENEGLIGKAGIEDKPESTTFYTTYTYFTTSYIGDSTVLKSRLETVTNIVSAKPTISEITANDLQTGRAVNSASANLIPEDDKKTTSKTVTSDLQTGLLSTIVSTSVSDGITTLYSTDIFGTFIDGLYAKVLESTTKIATEVEATPSISPAEQKTGIVSINEGRIVDADGVSTTFFTTKAIGTSIEQLYAQVVESTSSIVIDQDKKSALAALNDGEENTDVFRTGLVRLIEGSIVKDGTVTLYESRVIGTVIDGRYAQIIESTSSFKIEPSIAPSVVIKTEVTPTIQPSSSPPSIESSIAEDVKEEDEEEEDDDENGYDDKDKGRVKSRLTFQSRKRTFTPVIRPFASRNRPTFLPKKKTIGASSAQTITRAFTPTVTATLATKAEGANRNRFGGGRRSSTNVLDVRPSASTSGRKFSGRSRTSASSSYVSPSYSPSRARQSSARIAATPTLSLSSSRNRSFRVSSSRPPPSSEYSPFRSNLPLRPRIRPTVSGLPGRGISTTQATGQEEENDLTTVVTEDDLGVTYDDESTLTTTTTTTEDPNLARRNNNPLLRFRRPPLIPKVTTSTTPRTTTTQAPRRGILSGRNNRPTSATLTTPRTTVRTRPANSFANRSQLQNRPRPVTSLFPPRGLFKKPLPQGEEKEEDFEEDELEVENDEDNNFEESSAKEIETEAEEKIAEVPKGRSLPPVQIRPFRFQRPRTKRQAYEYGTRNRQYTESKLRRRNRPQVYERSDYYPEEEVTEAPRVTPRTGRTYTSRSRATTQAPNAANSPRIRPTLASAQKSQFTIREKDASNPRTNNFRRGQTPSRRVNSAQKTTESPLSRKPTRARTPASSQDYNRTPQRRNNYNNRRPSTTTRGRGRYGENEDTYTYLQPTFDGTITVTHKIPSEVSIPFVNGKNTEYRNVITAKPSLEVLGPHQYTVTTLNGGSVIFLNREVTETLNNGLTEITRFLIHETPTTSVTFTPTTIRGRRTSFSHIIPSTVYDVENVVTTLQPQIAANAPLANILLSQLLLGNLNLPPNQGIGLNPQNTPATPSTEYKTRTTTYVTSVTDHTSTVLPVTFRGKEILTTIVDSSVNVITATEYITETIVVTPTPNANNQINSLLLPALLQAQLLQTTTPRIQTHPLMQNPFQAGFGLDHLNLEVLQHHEDPKIARNNDIKIEREPEDPEEDGKPEPRMKPRKKSDRKQELQPEPAREVITLYVSGRRPGEFSTILSTVYSSDAPAAVRKRETALDDIERLLVEASEVKQVRVLASNLPDGKETSSESDPSYLDYYVASGISTPLENNEFNFETQSLESVLGDPICLCLLESHEVKLPFCDSHLVLDSRKQGRRFPAGIRIEKNEKDGRSLALGPVELRYNLATKVMSNGVEVIVATDRNLRPGEPEFLRLLSSTVTRPITLAPHTLVNHMSMVLSSESVEEAENELVSSLHTANTFVTRTYYTTYTYLTTALQNGETDISSRKITVSNIKTEELIPTKISENLIAPTSTKDVTLTDSPSLKTEIFHTTYTYLNTILDGEQPLVMTSRYTISNTVTALYDYFSELEPSEVYPTTNTYLKTVEFTKTLTDGTDSQIVSTKDVLTQVVITDARDRETVAKPMTTEVTKTYFVTYTYFSTYIDGDGTKVKSDVSVSSDVTIEKFYIKPKKTMKYTQEMTSITRTAPLNVLATRTYLTTLTYFTTLLQGPASGKAETIVTTRTRVMQNVVTETLSFKRLGDDYLIKLQNSMHHQGNGTPITTAAPSAHQMETLSSPVSMPPDESATASAGEAQLTRVEELKMTKNGHVKATPTLGKSKTTTVLKFKPNKPILNEIKAEALVEEESGPSEASVPPPSISPSPLFTNHRINQTQTAHPAQKTVSPEANEKEEQTQSVEKDEESAMPSASSPSKKKPSKQPGNDLPVNFLNLTSLGINGINVLGPVFNVMAELINNNINNKNVNKSANKLNETTATKSDHAAKKPAAVNVNPLLNFVSSLKATTKAESKAKPTTPRTPVYIPVGSFALAEDAETSESKSNLLASANSPQKWLDTQGKNLEKSKISENGITILEGGIPISPGQIITTNSDVIIGRPGTSGPRPPNFGLKDSVPIDMKPPPPPLTLELQADDALGQHSTIHSVKPGHQGDSLPPPFPDRGHRQKQRPHDSDALDLNPPPVPLSKMNVHRPITINHKPHEIVPYKADYVETNIIPIPVHLAENYLNLPGTAENAIGAVGKPAVNGHKGVLVNGLPNKNLPLVVSAHSNMEDRSSGQPLLVNIQPSQVANVVIPSGSSTALIINKENQHSLKGEVIDDPSPHPQPETVGFVGAEPVLRLENGDVTPPLQIAHKPGPAMRPSAEANRPSRHQLATKLFQSGGGHPGQHHRPNYHHFGHSSNKPSPPQKIGAAVGVQYGEESNIPKVPGKPPPEYGGRIKEATSRLPAHSQGVHYRDEHGHFAANAQGFQTAVDLKNPAKMGNGIYVDISPPGHLPPRPDFAVAHKTVLPSVQSGSANDFSNHQSGLVHDVPLNAQVQLGSGPNSEQAIKDILISINKYDKVKNKHQSQSEIQNFQKKPHEDFTDNLHPPPPPLKTSSNRRPPWAHTPQYHPSSVHTPQSPTNFMMPPPHVPHRPNYKPIADTHPGPLMIPVGAGAPEQGYPYPRPEDVVVIPHGVHSQHANNQFTIGINQAHLDMGDADDPIRTEDGEEIQESNARPLLPGQLPTKLRKNNRTEDGRPSNVATGYRPSDINAAVSYGISRPGALSHPGLLNANRPLSQAHYSYKNKSSQPAGLKVAYGLHGGGKYSEAEQIFGSKLNGNSIRPQKPQNAQETPNGGKIKIEPEADNIALNTNLKIQQNTFVNDTRTEIQNQDKKKNKPGNADGNRKPTRPILHNVRYSPKPFPNSGVIQLNKGAHENLWIAHGSHDASQHMVKSERPVKPHDQDSTASSSIWTSAKDEKNRVSGVGKVRPNTPIAERPEGGVKPSTVINHWNGANADIRQKLHRNHKQNTTTENQVHVARYNLTSQKTHTRENQTDAPKSQQNDLKAVQTTHFDIRNKSSAPTAANRHPEWVGNSGERNQLSHSSNAKHPVRYGEVDAQQASGSENVWLPPKSITEKGQVPQDQLTYVANPQKTNNWIGSKPTRTPPNLSNKRIHQNSTKHPVAQQNGNQGRHPQKEDNYRNRTSITKISTSAADINGLLTPPKADLEVMGLSPPPPERPRRPARPQRPKPQFKFEVPTTQRAPITIENDFPPVRSPDFNKKPIKPQDIFPPKLPENFIHHVPDFPVRTPKPRIPPEPARPSVTSLPINIPEKEQQEQASDSNEISQVFGLPPTDINGHSKPVSDEKFFVATAKEPKPAQKPETVLHFERNTERPNHSVGRPITEETTASTRNAIPPILPTKTGSGSVITGSETVFEPEDFSKYETPMIKETTERKKMITTLITTGSTTIFADFHTPRPTAPSQFQQTEREKQSNGEKLPIAPTHTMTLTVTTTMTTIVHGLGQKPSTKTIVLTKTILSTVVDKVTETQTLVRPTTATVTQTHTVATTKTALLVPTAIRPAPTNYYPGVTLKPEIFVADPHSKDTMTISVSSSMGKDRKSDDRRKHPERRPDATDNDSILVVMTNKHPKVNHSTDHFDGNTESVEGAGVFLGGVYNADGTRQYKTPVWQVECMPECKAARNERCQKVDGEMKCVCRPGFARMFPDRPCMPTYTYNMKLLLEKPSAEYFDDSAQSDSLSYHRLKALTKEGLDRMIMQSEYRDVFHGISVSGFQPTQKKTEVEFYVQLSENTDEAKLTDVFRKTLRVSNYSLGGTELYAARETNNLRVEDFNECLSSKFHDCSENARCFNLRGTYTCSCKEGFTDLSENSLFPGRMCSDMIGCEYCGYHGTCFTRDDDQITCECFQWYSGERCRINLKVLLIALVTIGSILLALLLVCGILTCIKKKSRNSAASRNNGSAGYLRYRGHPTQSLDKRAMIEADSSSESSVDNLPYVNPPPPPPSGTLSAKRKTVPRQNAKGPATRSKEAPCVEQQDRSVTVMIPRAKYRPVPPMPPLLTMSTFSPDKHLHRTPAQISTEQKLISYLEGNSREGQTSSDQKPSPKHYDAPRSGVPFKKEQRVFEYEYKTSNMQINDGTSSGERRSSKHGDSERRFRRHSDSTHLNSENSRNFHQRKYSAGALVSAGFEVSATVGLRQKDFDTSEDEQSGILNTSTMKSNRSQFTTLNRTGDHKTMSEARSYDETTIHPPTRTLKTNYSGSSPSSRMNNDESHTMVERDVGSTFIMPESHLFKPERDRGSDISTFDSL